MSKIRSYLVALVALGAAAAPTAPIAAAAERAQDTAPVRGEVQFWQRRCDSAQVCELPQPASPRLKVDGIVKRPAASGQLGQYTIELAAEAGLRLRLDVFWRIANPDRLGDVGYFVTQAVLERAADDGARAPAGRCSQYLDEASSAAFPVGACSGFVADDEGGYRELGVSFYKAR